ncbi:hypothetical protein [Microcystis phage Mae-JY09]
MSAPELMDRAALARYMGLTKVDVERVFRSVPVVSLPGSRKVYVRREDVVELIEAATTRPGQVRAA